MEQRLRPSRRGNWLCLIRGSLQPEPRAAGAGVSPLAGIVVASQTWAGGTFPAGAPSEPALQLLAGLRSWVAQLFEELE